MWTYPDESVAVALRTGLGRIWIGMGCPVVRFCTGLIDLVASMPKYAKSIGRSKTITKRKKKEKRMLTLIQHRPTNLLPHNPETRFPRR
jgi:hypothetical protein